MPIMTRLQNPILRPGTVADERGLVIEPKEIIVVEGGGDVPLPRPPVLVEGGDKIPLPRPPIVGTEGDDDFLITAPTAVDGLGGFDTIRFDFTASTVGIRLDLSALWSGGAGTLNGYQLRNVEAVGSAYSAPDSDNVIIIASELDDRIVLGEDYPNRIVLYGLDGDDLLVGGLGALSLGHAHPRWVDAIDRAVRTIGLTSNLVTTRPQAELAERITSLLPVPDGRVFFCNSGAEANEAALGLVGDGRAAELHDDRSAELVGGADGLVCGRNDLLWCDRAAV